MSSVHSAERPQPAGKAPEQALVLVAAAASWLINAPRFWVSRRLGRESVHQAFDSRAYLKQIFDAQISLHPEAIAKLLEYDFFTYLEEYACWFTQVHNYGHLGVNSSYPKSLDELGDRFVSEQKRQGHRLSRAQLEQFAMSWLMAWMSDSSVQPGEILVWVSPRGLVSEGYLGLENKQPVKVNFYQRAADGTTVFQQFTIWTSDEQLPQLQNQLLELVGGQEEWILPENQLRNSRHRTIARFLRLNRPILSSAEPRNVGLGGPNLGGLSLGGPGLSSADLDGLGLGEPGLGGADLDNSARDYLARGSLTPASGENLGFGAHADTLDPQNCEYLLLGSKKFSKIFENILYHSETGLNSMESWPVQRDQLLISSPEQRPLFEEVTQIFSRSFVELVQLVLQPLLERHQSLRQLQRVENWPSLLRVLDQIFELHFKAVVAVVTQLKKIQGSLGGQGIGTGTSGTGAADQAAVVQMQLNSIRASSLDLVRAYQTKTPLSSAQSQNLLALTQTLNLVTQQTASAAQCGILAPFSMAVKGAGRLSQLTAPGLPGWRPEFGRAIEKMGGQLSDAELLHQLETQNYVELDLSAQGGRTVYMVPAAYLDGLGCAVVAQNRVVGPCPDEQKLSQAGLSLTDFGQMDPNLQHQYCIDLSDPRDTMALEMNQRQFDEFLAQLQQQVKAGLQDELGQFEEELNNSDELSASEKALALEVYQRLIELVFRDTISVDQFLSGSDLSTEGLLQLPTELVAALRSCSSFRDKVGVLMEWSVQLHLTPDSGLEESEALTSPQFSKPSTSSENTLWTQQGIWPDQVATPTQTPLAA